MTGFLKKHTDLQNHYDAIVVGSGYGGGVAACRLARMGLAVAVFEKGRAWRPGDFGGSLGPMMRNTRLSGRRIKLGRDNNLFDLRLGRDLHVLLGCGLGGGSLVNAGLAMRPDAAVFSRPGWPAAIADDPRFTEGFARAERMLGVADCPEGDRLARFKALERVADALHARAEPASATINYRPGVNRANVMQPACTKCGDCWAGCNTGAKNTVAITYLADAVAHGAAIFTGVSTTSLEREGGRWRLQFERLDDKTGKSVGRGEVSAGLVVLAAGVFGSTEILMRARDKGLAVSDRLGKGVSANGDDFAFGHDMPFVVDGVAVGFPRRTLAEREVGPNCVGMIRVGNGEAPQSDEVAPFLVQAGAMPLPLSAMAPLKALLRGKPGRTLKMLWQGPYDGPLANSLMCYVVGHDSAAGELSMQNGRIVLDWPTVREEPVFDRARAALTGVIEGFGGDFVQNPFRDRLLGGRPITAHPLGGCGMGETAADGVVDHRGRVFDAAAGGETPFHDGLYVVDGSTVPTSLAANPLLTIAALAERAMMLLAQEREMPFDDAPKEGAPLRDALM